MRSQIARGLLLACLALGPSPRVAAAADPPCLADIKKFCAAVPVGGGRVQACLKEHEAQISEACRTRVDDLQREAAMVDTSCRWDIISFCSDVNPGGGRVISCLESNKISLSASCLNLLQSMGKKP
jgi:hypothetical protein